LAEAWELPLGIELDRAALQAALLEAAAAGAAWLLHPCLSALTWPRQENPEQRAFQLAVWAAVNGAPVGEVAIDRPLWAWSAGGGYRVPAGAHDLKTIADGLAAQGAPGALAVDPWARSMNVAFVQLWQDLDDYGDDQQTALRSELRRLFRAQAALEGCLTACFDWATSVTQVVVPLRQTSGERSDSSSSPQLPGAVFLTLQSELQVMEAVVHESAHQHLFLVEAEGPLIDPAHTATFRSPLRPDPRPLRGVLLAYHALAYIVACYTDSLDRRMADQALLEKARAEARAGLIEAEETVMANRRHLTVLGAEFVDRTADVARYGG
jgi:HEXXH motif-containing protein